jgi:hypothetical protein
MINSNQLAGAVVDTASAKVASFDVDIWYAIPAHLPEPFLEVGPSVTSSDAVAGN